MKLCGFKDHNGNVCAREAGHPPYDGPGHRTAEFIVLLAEFDAATPAGETSDARSARAEAFNKKHGLPK